MTLIGRPVALLAAFLRWWLAELAGLVPAGLRRALRPSRPIFLLETEASRVRFRLFRGQRSSELGALELSAVSPDRQRAEIAEIARRVKLGKSDVALRLPAALALHRSVTLPLAAEADLRQAIAFQLDRQTPFAPEDIAFDYSLRERSAAQQSVTADLTMVPRRDIEAALARARDWGLEPDIVDVAGDAPERPPAINLLSDRVSVSRRRWARLDMALGLAAVVLLAAAILVPLGKRQAQLEGLQRELAVAKLQAEKVLRIKEEIALLRSENSFLLEEKERLPLRTLLLDELTRILPDGTWATELQIRGKTIRLKGYSSSAASLIGIIDAEPGLVMPAFRSSVKRDPRSGAETFSLSFETLEGQQGL